METVHPVPHDPTATGLASPSDELDERQNSLSWKPLAWIGLSVLVIQSLTGLVIFKLLTTWPDRSAFGDMFGFTNTLFSGLAFAGVIYAIFLQRRELELQRMELRLTRDELRRTATAQEKSEQALKEQAEELIRQRRLSILPAFVAQLKQDKPGGLSHHRLYLKNVGIGMAINIEIARIDFISPPDEVPSPTTEITVEDIKTHRVLGGKNGYSVFQPIQSLSSGGEQIVEHTNHFDPGMEVEGEVLRVYGLTGLDFLSLIGESNPLHIDFLDIEGCRYHQIITRKGNLFVPSPVKLIAETDRK
jgi:hypothetical protein